MVTPTSYNRATSFTDAQAADPSAPLSGPAVDNEFNNVKLSLDTTQQALALVQRADGALANNSVGADQIDPSVYTGLSPATSWMTATNYFINQTVLYTTGIGYPKLYRCAVSHASGTFATDLAAGKWVVLVDYAPPSPLPVINGGTGVTTSTGTGDLVLSDAPALNAPTVEGGAAVTGRFPTVAAMLAATDLIAGAQYDVAAGALGGTERFRIVLAATYTGGTGNLVQVTATPDPATGFYWAESTRQEYASYAEAKADPRTFTSGYWSMSFGAGGQYVTSGDNWGQTTAGGSKLLVEWGDVRAWGAIADGISVTATLSIASGSAALTATGAAFTSEDVGKTINVPGAGAGGGPLTTTILAYVSSTSVTLATNASTTLSSVSGNLTYGTENSQALQYAVTYGVTAVIPDGTFLVASSILGSNNKTVKGVSRDASIILVGNDIEVFNSDTSTVNSSIFGFVIQDLTIQKTVNSATTKYDIHLQNPSNCRVLRVKIQSGHIDSQYSSTNVGGVFFDKPSGSTQPSYLNKVNDSWIVNNSVYFKNVTDSEIRGGWVWGHVRQFAIRLESGGNCAVQNVLGIITSQYNGGVWIDGVGANQHRIQGNEFDGNPAIQTGTCLYCPQKAITITFTGNTCWGQAKSGIDVTDPEGWNATGNSFYQGNSADAGHSDIIIRGVTYSPNRNVFSANTHVIDGARTNPGYAIKEVNGGFNPVNNVYQSNAVTGPGYQTPGFLIIQQAVTGGNSGMGTEDQTQFGGINKINTDGKMVSQGGLIAAAGTLDLVMNDESYAGNPGGFAGILAVTATRYNFATQSSHALYSIVGYGSTATITQLVNQNGSGGGSAFTIAMSANGTVRLTDTSASGSQIYATMAYFGVDALA